MVSGISVNSISKNPDIGYTPKQIKKAYNLGSTGNGKNISVAVIDFIGNPYIESNLKVFSRQYNLKHTSIKNIGESGNRSYNFSAYIEPVVDSQWVHAISQESEIYIIKAPSYTIEGAISAINMAKEEKCDVILLTFQTEMTANLAEMSSLFDYQGVFVASAGDFGAQANFPACVPNCIAVGGTSLKISSDGERISDEVVWDGTGGGICSYFDIPEYQKRMEGINEITDNKRGVPDVSFFASPTPGFSVYHSSNYGSFGWYSVGGTSISAACVAGIVANMLSSEKFEGVTGKNIHQVLYEIAGGDIYRNQFSKYIDIIYGSNGDFNAKLGYDLCTGLGSLFNI